MRRKKLSLLGSVLILLATALSSCGPTPEGDKTPEAPDPVWARDVALEYLAQEHGTEAPALDLRWVEENTTPDGLVGSSDFVFTSGDWIVMVSFPIVAPDATTYQIEVNNEASGFQWQGEVDAAGQVSEAQASPTRPAGLAQAGEIYSDVERVTAPDVDEMELIELVDGNSAFAFDLYQALKERDGNLFYSPYSISLALAMTYAGARSQTEDQMAAALHFVLSQDSLHPAFNSLDLELARRGEGAAGKDGQGFRLNIVNAIWGLEGYHFLPAFLDTLAENYGAGLKTLDFVQAPEESRLIINDWVSEQTENRIQDLLPQGAIDALTRMILTNAIYFNAAWAEPFEPKATQDGPFYRLAGDEITVPMMRQTASYGYTTGSGYQAVELPYDGRELAMVILLPEAGEFEAFEGSLDVEGVDAILGDLAYREIALTMPKFEFESDFDLKDTLSTLGMSAAFSKDADFTGMTGDRELFIADVIHKAFVAVDEEGTEAAAATAVVVGVLSAPPEPISVTIDHPFIFFIRDIKTGTILFVGRVLDPGA